MSVVRVFCGRKAPDEDSDRMPEPIFGEASSPIAAAGFKEWEKGDEQVVGGVADDEGRQMRMRRREDDQEARRKLQERLTQAFLKKCNFFRARNTFCKRVPEKADA